MQDTGHPGKHLGTLQIVSIFAFLPQNVPPIVSCTCVHPYDVIAANMMPLMVGHTLKYIVSKSEVNQTDGS